MDFLPTMAMVSTMGLVTEEVFRLAGSTAAVASMVGEDFTEVVADSAEAVSMAVGAAGTISFCSNQHIFEPAHRC